MLGIIHRYLLKETVQTWGAVTLVLLLILISNRFAQFLGEAAAGNLPQAAVFKLLALSTISYLTVIVPVGLFFAAMLALGRFYRDSEMTAMMACGIGPGEVYRALMVFAGILAIVLAGLALEAGPWAAAATNTVRKDAEKQAEIGSFEAGRFKTPSDGKGVFYAERVAGNGKQLRKVFMEKRDGRVVYTVTAARGTQVRDPETGEKMLVLEEGYRYEVTPGSARIKTVKFAEHGMKVEAGSADYSTTSRDVIPTATLWNSSSRRDTAELQWRISVPLTALVLCLLAVPLARTTPRQGRYGKLLLAVLVYIVYSNMLGVARVWVERGRVSTTFGIWWVHILVAVLALFMLARQQSVFRRLRGNNR